MPTPQQTEHAVQKVRDQKSFIQELLVGALEWPIDGKPQSVEEIAYGWTQQELRAADLDKKILDGQVLQIANLRPNQPWGIFVLEFKDPAPFLTERGMTGVLRKVLRGLVPSRRKEPGLSSWKREHLLFICTHKYEHFRLAYFKSPADGSKTAPLAAFGWGPDIPARTACEFNLPPLEWPADSADGAAWVSKWASAFDVEKVTKRFYEDYAKHDQKLRQAVAPLLNEKDIEAESVKMFVQSLLNRLMFLRFIERKGWLVAPGGGASKDYLRLLYAAGKYRGKSFYTGRLHKLFFEGLAIEGKQESEAIGKVPFLNGGLFEESDLDKKVEDIDDDAFKSLLGPEGLFYRYNFTVQESTPLDIEVAVDPEMLGKVFEELVTGRHESGSYYTPRPVVSFMCREALKGYLADAAQIDADKVAAFVDRHETPFGINEAKQLAKALDDVRAVDPACGSGAYLLGLLHEMVDLYRLLYSDKLKTGDRELHRIKLDIIEKSLYGVDIDPFATNIAMLRLWLSLTVDSDAPRALPNLDFKIETGDSLTGPNPQQYSVLHLHEPARQLAILKGKYMRARGEEKQSLRRLINKEQKELAFQLRSLCPGAIDWRVQFCEVFFSDREGFDIVLANPPYIRQELIKDQKPALKKVYGNLFSGTADLYVFFYLRALQLLANGGMLVFISSNKWFRAGYGEKLRALIAKTTSVRTILDFHDLPVFESAIAYPMIFVAAKREPSSDHTATLAEPPDLCTPYPDVAAVVTKHGHRMPATALGRDGTWHLATSSAADRLAKMRAAGPTLREFVQAPVYRGVTTGLNEAFVIDDETRRSIIACDPNSKEIIKPFLTGKDVKRWVMPEGERWLIFTRRGVDGKQYPGAISHLKAWRSALMPRKPEDDADTPRRKPGSYAWYEIQDEVAYHNVFPKPKILSTKVSVRPTFTLDRCAHFVGNTSYVIPATTDPLFLLAVLNSSASEFYARSIYVGKQGGWYEVQPKTLESMPIPTASTTDHSTIAALAQKCLDAKGFGCEAWEKEIDERVAALYGL